MIKCNDIKKHTHTQHAQSKRELTIFLTSKSPSYDPPEHTTHHLTSLIRKSQHFIQKAHTPPRTVLIGLADRYVDTLRSPLRNCRYGARGRPTVGGNSRTALGSRANFAQSFIFYIGRGEAELRGFLV